MEYCSTEINELDIWNKLEAISFLVTAIATITAATIVVWNTRRINRINNIKNHYSDFWDDKAISSVRVSIANEKAYSQLKPILIARNENKELTKKQYRELDKIDKFINMIMLIRGIGFRKSKLIQRSLLFEELMLQFWLIAPVFYKRAEFVEYIKNQYEFTYYPRMMKEDKRRGRVEEKLRKRHITYAVNE